MIDENITQIPHPALNGFAPTKELQELVVMPASDRMPVKVPEDAEEPSEEAEPKFKYWRELVSFWILGLCNNYGYVVMLSAAHDIIAQRSPSHEATGTGNSTDPNHRDCNILSTGAILLADIIPAFFTKIVIPFFPLWIHFRMATSILLACAGFILVGASDSTMGAIVGVVATSFASGIGEATLLSYMPFFRTKNVLSTWSSGTGGAGFFGSFTYAFFTSVGLSPSMTLYVMLVVPALMSVTFWGLLKRPDVREAANASTSSEVASGNNTEESSEEEGDRIPLTYTNETFWEKFSFIPSLVKYMIPIGLVYFFEYLINQGLFELINFDNTSINHAAQYRWYQVMYQIGVFISRSSINLVTIKHIWLLAVLQGVNFVLFSVEAVYLIVPNFYIVLAFVLWEGLLGGAAYVNTFHRINTEVVPEKREFSMAICTVADSLGITLSGFLSIPIHNFICGLPKKM